MHEENMGCHIIVQLWQLFSMHKYIIVPTTNVFHPSNFHSNRGYVPISDPNTFIRRMKLHD